MTYRARNIGLAVGLGLVAVLLVTLYVKNSNSDSPSTTLGEKLVSVFIASHDISAGTPGSELTSAIQPQQVLRSTVVAGAISSKDQVKGLVSTAPILAGQQVTQRQFQRNTGEGISGEITRTQRAYQLAGDANQLLVNTLQPGDRVDVLASVKYAPGDLRAAGAGGDTSSTGVASRIMLRNLLVLQQPETPAGAGNFGNNGAYAIILRVTDQQAQKLFYVVKNADWALMLRPARAAGDSPGSAETTGSILTDGLRTPQLNELLNGPQP